MSIFAFLTGRSFSSGAMVVRSAVLFVFGLRLATATSQAQSLRVSFDSGLKADQAIGRSEPWVSKAVELVPGKFGKAAHIGPGGELIYAVEQNFQAGRGTLACWCRIPERPGPLDIQRLIVVRIDGAGKIDEITEENNAIVWKP